MTSFDIGLASNHGAGLGLFIFFLDFLVSFLHLYLGHGGRIYLGMRHELYLLWM
jgi:hypothetical protein